jgi:hypothetical protein
MPTATKLDSIDIKSNKLTKSTANDQLQHGDSRIDTKHFEKFVAKCGKDEKTLLVALKIDDKRAAKK